MIDLLHALSKPNHNPQEFNSPIIKRSTQTSSTPSIRLSMHKRSHSKSSRSINLCALFHHARQK